MCIDVVESSYEILVSGCGRGFEGEDVEGKVFYYELFGLDFMID